MGNFLLDRSIGKKGELFVCAELTNCGFYCELVTGRNLDYDIVGKYRNTIFFIEVKNDRKATFTGNIAIEFYNANKGTESGISATKSDYWAHIVGGKLYLIKSSKLRQLIKDLKPLKIIEGGDNNSMLYIYEQSVLKHPFFFLHNNQFRRKTWEYILCELREHTIISGE